MPATGYRPLSELSPSIEDLSSSAFCFIPNSSLPSSDITIVATKRAKPLYCLGCLLRVYFAYIQGFYIILGCMQLFAFRFYPRPSFPIGRPMVIMKYVLMITESSFLLKPRKSPLRPIPSLSSPAFVFSNRSLPLNLFNSLFNSLLVKLLHHPGIIIRPTISFLSNLTLNHR